MKEIKCPNCKSSFDVSEYISDFKKEALTSIEFLESGFKSLKL